MAAGLLSLALYLSTLDMRANFDALISASWAETWRPENGLKPLFAFNHFLFNATGRLLYKALRPWHVAGYRTLQYLNAFAGAGTLALLLFFILKRTKDPAWAAGWTALCAGGQAFWRQAVSGEAYTCGTFWALAGVVQCARYAESPSALRAVLAALLCALGAMYHTGNAVLCAVLLFTLLRARRVLSRDALAALGVGLLMLYPYARMHGLFSWQGIQGWFIQSSYSPRIFEKSLAGTVWSLHLGASLKGFLDSLLSLEAGAAALAVFLGFLALGSFKTAGEFRERPARPAFLLCASAFLVLLLFYSVWQAAAPYWCVHAPFFAAALALAGPPRRLRASRLAALWGAALLGALTTLSYSALPNMNLRNFPTVEFSQTLRDQTPEGSFFLISGSWSDLKVHLPFFARRKRLALELYLIQLPKVAALAKLSENLARLRQAGLPLYLLSELRSPESLDFLGKNWGVTHAELDALLAPYEEKAVARVPLMGGPAQELILLWPRNAGEASLLQSRLAGPFAWHARRSSARRPVSRPLPR